MRTRQPVRLCRPGRYFAAILGAAILLGSCQLGTVPATSVVQATFTQGQVTATPEAAVTQTEAPTATVSTDALDPTSSPTLASKQTCPTDVDVETSIANLEGTLVLGFRQPGERFSIWRLGRESGNPVRIYELPEGASPISEPLVAGEGNILAWLQRVDGQTSLVVYDLQSGKADSYSLSGSWYQLSRSVADSEIIVGAVPHEEANIGISHERLVFDLETRSFAEVAHLLELPGYLYFAGDRWAPFETFAVPDPSGTLVLYAAFGDAGTRIVLYDLQTRQAIWSRQLQGGYKFIPQPSWASDGRRVALSYWSDQDDTVYELVMLDATGHARTIQAQLAATEEYFAVRHLQWSPTQRFLFVALGAALPNVTGPGFMIDFAEAQAMPTCDPEDRAYLGGIWLGETEKFAYAIRDESGVYQYWLLDAENWAKTMVIESEDMPLLPFIAWTPLRLTEQVSRDG